MLYVPVRISHVRTRQAQIRQVRHHRRAAAATRMFARRRSTLAVLCCLLREPQQAAALSSARRQVACYVQSACLETQIVGLTPSPCFCHFTVLFFLLLLFLCRFLLPTTTMSALSCLKSRGYDGERGCREVVSCSCSFSTVGGCSLSPIKSAISISLSLFCRLGSPLLSSPAGNSSVTLHGSVFFFCHWT